MKVQARLKNYRISARKARLIADEIRGRGVEDALTILDLSTKRFSKPLAKLVRSALASAEVNIERDRASIDIDNLVVETITVDQGSSMWRIRPRAQGRAAWIQRRTSHVSVILAEQ
jgi:large subunit ribosomal protein L22